MSSRAPQIPDFQPDTQRPPFIPYDLGQMQSTAQNTALQTLGATNRARANLNPDWDRALKLGAAGMASDAAGDTTLLPAAQAEAMRSGISGALGSFGDAGATPTLDATSAATGRVSQSIFGSVNALGQQVRDNRYRALQVGNQIFPDTQIGLSGQDAALISGANTLGYNSFNEANFRDAREDERLNWRVHAENIRTQVQQSNIDAQASAQSDAVGQQALVQGGAAVAGVAVLAIAL